MLEYVLSFIVMIPPSVEHCDTVITSLWSPVIITSPARQTSVFSAQYQFDRRDSSVLSSLDNIPSELVWGVSREVITMIVTVKYGNQVRLRGWEESRERLDQSDIWRLLRVDNADDSKGKYISYHLLPWLSLSCVTSTHNQRNYLFLRNKSKFSSSCR